MGTTSIEFFNQVRYRKIYKRLEQRREKYLQVADYSVQDNFKPRFTLLIEVPQ